MELQCKFRHTTFSDETRFYSCVVLHQQIPENQEFKFIGQHNYGKTNNDVIYVEFNNCVVTKIPQGLTKIFPNMKMLWICKGKVKNICKNDLAEYKNLERFTCIKNEIEFLPGDLFENNKNLNWIRFNENNLKVIEPNIFDGLVKLTFVDIDCKPYFGEWYSAEYAQGSSLEEVRKNLVKKFVEYSRNLKTSEEELREEVQQLHNSKAELEQQNQVVKESNEKLQQELEQEKLKNTELTAKPASGFLEDLKTFTQDETTKDFKIVIGAREFPVHKFLLAARSPTLAELLKINPEIENLNLVDISVETFEKILKFFYTDELPGDNGTNFLHLFAAAGKLKIDELKNYAAKKLIDQIDENNSLEVLKLSNKYDNEELRQKAFNELKSFYSNYKFKDEWITKPEIIVKAIEQFRKAEEEIRKLEEKFDSAEI